MCFSATANFVGSGVLATVGVLTLTRVKRPREPRGGGLRMGNRCSTECCRSDLKVHGLDNLHVASCAVFPSGSGSNPAFTIMALTLRLSHHLARRSQISAERKALNDRLAGIGTPQRVQGDGVCGVTETAPGLGHDEAVARVMRIVTDGGGEAQPSLVDVDHVLQQSDI